MRPCRDTADNYAINRFPRGRLPLSLSLRKRFAPPVGEEKPKSLRING